MNAFLEAAINGWWQGIVLTLLVWLVMRDLPRVSAATRVAIWQVTLGVVLLLPVLQRIPIPHWPDTPAVEKPAADSPVARVRQEPTSPTAATVGPSAPIAKIAPVVEFGDGELFLAIAVSLAFSGLLRLGFSYLAIRRLKRRAVPMEAGLPGSLMRPTRVMASGDIPMPMAIGYFRPSILLPSAMLNNLTSEQLRHVLLHETAHLRRRDDWAALAERLLRAVFAIQPAVHFIGRQIEREREIACDDWVVEQSGEAKPYAYSLARLAELGSSRRAPILATGVGRKKQIFARLETLLDRTRNRIPVVSEPLVLVAGVMLLVAVSHGARFNHLFGLSSFSNSWTENDGNHRREFKMRGDVRFTADDKDVESMSPGALLVVEKAEGWSSSERVIFEGGDDGVIARRYFLDGAERPYDAAAQRFATSMLQPWVREQGGNIPERLTRMIQEKGVDGALEDIRLIRGTGVKRAYLQELFHQTSPNKEQLRRVLRVAGEMGSDEDKRQFMESAASRYLEQGMESAVADYIDTVHSDDERRQLLTLVIDGAKADFLPRLFRSVSGISSDQVKTHVLLQAVQSSKGSLPEEFYDAASGIHSDGERRRLLLAAVSSRGREGAELARILKIAASMNSDEEKAKIVVEASSNFKGGEDTLREASRLLSSIHSDGERRRALEALLAADGGNASSLKLILTHALTMNSDEEKARVLNLAAGNLTDDEPSRRAYFSVLHSIHSSGEQRNVLLALLARAELKPGLLDEVARTAAGIGSYEDRDAVLRALAGRR